MSINLADELGNNQLFILLICLINKQLVILLIFFNNEHFVNAVTTGKVSHVKQVSPADARVARNSSACIPPSWIFEISKLHH